MLKLTSFSNLFPKEFLAFFAWIIALVFLLVQLMVQFSSGLIIEPLSQTFGLKLSHASLLASSYYYIYVLMQIPIGMIIDQFGARRVMIVGGIIAVIGSEIFAESHTLWVAEVSRIMLGAGLSGVFVCLIYLLSRWFDQARFSRIFAISEAVATLSIMVGNLWLSYWLRNAGWRTSAHYISYTLAALVFLTWLLVFDGPKDSQTRKLTLKNHLSNLKRIAKSRYAWACAFYCGTMFCANTVFVALWAYPLFMSTYPLSDTNTIFILGTTMVGLALGCITLPRWLSRSNGLAFLLFSGPLVVSIMLWAILVYIDRPIWELVVEMFVLGIASSTYLLGYILLHRRLPKHMKSTGTGFVNAIGVGFAPLLQPLVGLLIDWHHASHQLAPMPTKDNYVWALCWLMGFILVTGSLSAYWLTKKRYRSS